MKVPLNIYSKIFSVFSGKLKPELKLVRKVSFGTLFLIVTISVFWIERALPSTKFHAEMVSRQIQSYSTGVDTIEIGYDDRRQDTYYDVGDPNWAFIKFPQYYAVPYQILKVGLCWSFCPDSIHICVYPDNGFGRPDLLHPYETVWVGGGDYYYPLPWKEYDFGTTVSSDGDIWVGVRAWNHAWLGADTAHYNGRSFWYDLQHDEYHEITYGTLMVRLVLEGTPLSHDVLPQSPFNDFTLDVPDRHTAPANNWCTPRATVRNVGANSETFSVTLKIDSSGIIIYTSTQTISNLQPNSVAHIVFDPWWVGHSGVTYEAILYTNLLNDLYLSNDTLRVKLTAAHTELCIYDHNLMDCCYTYGGIGGEVHKEEIKRITPSGYPAQVEGIYVHASVSEEVPIEVHFWSDKNPDDFYHLEPDTLIGEMSDSYSGGWKYFDVSDSFIVIHEGEFYVSYHAGVNCHRCESGPRYPERTGNIDVADHSIIQVNKTHKNQHIRALVRYLTLDVNPPTMEPILEPEGQYYSTAPSFSNFGFDDDNALDDGWYQMDSYTNACWVPLFTDISGTEWNSDGWIIPGFDSLPDGSHTIYFKASDDSGNVKGKSGVWSWQFYKDTQVLRFRIWLLGIALREFLIVLLMTGAALRITEHIVLT